jgi:hypothetical protein
MQAFDPHLAAAVSTMGAALLMIMSGLHKSMLEWRSNRHRCPSCGRQVSGRRCACTR